MRELNYGVEGKVNLRTFAVDERGSGNANHIYHVTGKTVEPRLLSVEFQNGPIAESGINGIQNEDLLAILIDRFEGFQSGKFACQANEEALEYCEAALTVLHQRTRERMARGVEGTHTV